MRALVAMSGGVDSSVAAALAASTYGPNNVWGVHMKLSESEGSCNINSRSCCSSKDAVDAQTVANRLGIYFDEINFVNNFHKTVITRFVQAYAAGRNAQPCMDCNYFLKFNELVDLANRMDCEKIITGHYVGLDQHGMYIADDTRKDQSYYLWQINKNLYPRLEFPLANYTKSQTRETAGTLGLVTATKRESMDICFVPNGDYREVLKSFLPETPGNICLADGTVIGAHTGYWKFTVGQRRGIPVTNNNIRYYVSRIDPENNLVYVAETATTKTLFEADLNFSADPNTEYFVKVRHGPTLTPCRINNNTITTTTPLVITPGQAAVIYKLGNNRHYLQGGGYIA